MTLSLLADHLIDHLNLSADLTAPARARRYLRLRYEALWSAVPWRDTLTLLTLPLAEGQSDVLLPPTVLQVLAARWHRGTVAGPESFSASHPHLPESWGDRLQFTPAGRAILGPTAATGTLGGELLLGFTGTGSGDTGTIQVETEDRHGRITRAGIALPLTSFPHIIAYGRWILTAHKPATVATYALTAEAWPGTLPLAGTGTAWPRSLRLRLAAPIPAPSTAALLIQRTPGPLLEDHHEPERPGFLPALLAGAAADLLEHAREWSEARSKNREAAAELTTLRQREAATAPTVPRIVPG